MCRLLIILLVLLCLMTGCKASDSTEQPPAESEDLDALFDNKADSNVVSGVEFSLEDPLEMVYSYNGQPLEIPFTHNWRVPWKDI